MRSNRIPLEDRLTVMRPDELTELDKRCTDTIRLVTQRRRLIREERDRRETMHTRYRRPVEVEAAAQEGNGRR